MGSLGGLASAPKKRIASTARDGERPESCRANDEARGAIVGFVLLLTTCRAAEAETGLLTALTGRRGGFGAGGPRGDREGERRPLIMEEPNRSARMDHSVRVISIGKYRFRKRKVVGGSERSDGRAEAEEDDEVLAAAGVSRETAAVAARHHRGMEEEDEILDIEDMEAEGVDQDEEGYFCELPVPSVYFKFVIGRRGMTKQAIERETSTAIRIPNVRRRQDSRQQRPEPDPAGSVPPILIRGPSARAVASARTRIEILITNSAPKLDYTHFVSVPLVDAADEVATFQRELVDRFGPESAAPVAGLDPSVLVRPSQLHLTLTMLRLYREEDVRRAGAALRRAEPALLESLHPTSTGRSAAWRISLRGLEYMNDDASEVHVLYAGVKDVPASRERGAVEALTAAWRIVVDELMREGLLDDRELERQRMRAGDGTLAPKLHVTLLNTKLRRGEERREGERVPVDVRSLLEAYPQSREIAQARIREIHLSIRGPFGADGFYRNAARLEVAE